MGRPTSFGRKHVPGDLGPGYDYDVCNTEVLLTRLAVEDRYLVLPDGVRYRALVLPESQTMTVEVARKLRELARAGATIIGPKPARDPGLKNYPQCDRLNCARSRRNCGVIAPERIFGKPPSLVRGRVVWGKAVREILLRRWHPARLSISGGHRLTGLHSSRHERRGIVFCRQSQQPAGPGGLHVPNRGSGA
jgi:hypothetical protein